MAQWATPVWVRFDKYHGAEIINAVSAYLKKTPVEKISADELQRIAQSSIVYLVVDGKKIIWREQGGPE